MVESITKLEVRIMNKLNNINSKQDHILACLSSAPSNAKIIRTAARMAKAFDSRFTA